MGHPPHSRKNQLEWATRLPSQVIDRDAYVEGAVSDSFTRAHEAIPQLLAAWKRRELSEAVLEGFAEIMEAITNLQSQT